MYVGFPFVPVLCFVLGQPWKMGTPQKSEHLWLPRTHPHYTGPTVNAYIHTYVNVRMYVCTYVRTVCTIMHIHWAYLHVWMYIRM